MNRSLPRRLAPLALVAALGCLLLAAAISPAATQRTVVTSNCNNAAFKPAAITLTCGDAGLRATKLKWASWTSKEALGGGTGEVKICNPNCAAGRVAKADMDVRLFQPKTCPQDGKRHFTKVRYTWTEGAPKGAGPKSDSIPLPCALVE